MLVGKEKVDNLKCSFKHLAYRKGGDLILSCRESHSVAAIWTGPKQSTNGFVKPGLGVGPDS